METVSHRPETIASPVNFKLHHYPLLTSLANILSKKAVAEEVKVA